MRRSHKALVAALATVAFVAAACGDDGGSSAATTTKAGSSTTAAAGGASTTSAATGCKFDRSIKIVALVEKPPEGPNAIPDFANGFDMAVEEINASGGVCGQKIDFERLPASPTDSAAAKSAFLTAIDKKADVIVGFPATSTVIALSPEIAKAATPTIYLSTAAQALVGAKDGVGSEWGFALRPRATGIGAAQAEYIVKDMGIKDVGLLCANNATGVTGCDSAKAKIAELGGKVVGTETHEIADTNLTSKVIALKNSGAKAIYTATFPNNLVTFVNAAVDNGLSVPIFGGSSAALAIATKNVKPEALKNFWGYEDCVPVNDAKDWAAKYQAKFNGTAAYAAAESYDAIKLIATAAQQAGKLDKKAIADGLRSVNYKGVCSTYRSDAGQDLNQSGLIVSFDDKGAWVSKKVISITS
jgi:branched-chain amino acid transport system substrate-binding protein